MKRKAKAAQLEKNNYKWIYLFLLPSLAIFVLFYLIPIITVVATSFTKWDGFNQPVFNGIHNYIKLFTSTAFQISLRNLLLWAAIAMTLHVGFGVLVAFVLFYQPFGWKITRAVFMIPNVISMAAWALIYKFIFNNNIGILNNLIRFIMPGFDVQWFYSSPYAFWAVTLTWLFYSVIVSLLVYNDLVSIPDEINEAARIDGAANWQSVFYVQLPLCRGAIGTSIIASITSRIAMYESIALTTAGGPGDDTMNIPLILVNSILDMNYGYANANGVVMIVLGLIILVLINKLFRMNDPVR